MNTKSFSDASKRPYRRSGTTHPSVQIAEKRNLTVRVYTVLTDVILALRRNHPTIMGLNATADSAWGNEHGKRTID